MILICNRHKECKNHMNYEEHSVYFICEGFDPKHEDFNVKYFRCNRFSKSFTVNCETVPFTQDSDVV